MDKIDNEAMNRLDHSDFNAALTLYCALWAAHKTAIQKSEPTDNEIKSLFEAASKEAQTSITAAGPPGSSIRKAFMGLMESADKDWYAYQMAKDDQP